MTLNEALITVIRQLVEDRGMTITGLARVSGMSRNSLTNYISRGRSGDRTPRTMPIDVIADIAKGFQMTTYDLVRMAEDHRDKDGRP